MLTLDDFELTALAAVLENRHPSSRLAETVRNGNDPHFILAAALYGTDLDRFLSLAIQQPAESERWFQLARCLLRAVPRAASAGGIQILAQQEYGWELLQNDAARYQELTLDTFPELREYLQDDILERFAINLRMPVDEVMALLQNSDQLPWSKWITQVFFDAGDPGTAHVLSDLCRCVEDYYPGMPRPSRPDLYDILSQRDFVTPVGQVIGKASPWDSIGSAHLHLADAARKASLYALVATGAEILAIFGKDVIIQTDANQGERPGHRLAQVAIEAASCVLGGMPVVCRHRSRQ